MKRKLGKIYNIVRELDLDLLILTSSPNIEYLLGIEFETPTAFVSIYRDGTYRVYVSKLDYWRVLDLAHLEEDNVVPFSRPGVGEPLRNEVDLHKLPRHMLQEDRVKRIGVDNVANKLLDRIRKERDIEIVDVQDRILDVRSVKDEDEVRLVTAAVRIAERCLEETLHRIGPGVREIDVESWLSRCIVEHEAGLAFRPIVASGPNSSYPHHVSTRRRIERGDIVIVDLGAKYRCYCSDITRTIVVGSPSPRQREVIEKVAEAQDIAIKRVKPGVEAEEVDLAARQTLGEHARFFIHSTGHGIGVECHERPNIAPGEKKRIEKGNIFTVEPGVYMRGEFGVRIEDDVLVTENGGVLLSRFPRLLV